MRPAVAYRLAVRSIFQSTHPIQGCDYVDNNFDLPAADFNPRTPYRDATRDAKSFRKIMCNFNPRTPYRDATKYSPMYDPRQAFQSTHPIQGCDLSIAPVNPTVEGISIHAPHTGMRRILNFDGWWILLFQSTHPIQGCDNSSVAYSLPSYYFNPRTPYRDATTALFDMIFFSTSFQSTHPIQGCDCKPIKKNPYF